MMAAAALRPHKSSPARVPTRCVAALCAACFLVGVGVVNRSVRLPSPLLSPALKQPASLRSLASLLLPASCNLV